MEDADNNTENQSIHENVDGQKILLRLKSIGKSVCIEYTIEKDKSSILQTPAVHILAASLTLLFLSLLCCFMTGVLICTCICGFVSYHSIWHIKKEVLLITIPLGLQFTAFFKSGHHRTCFIPWNCIRDIYIVEAISLHRVLYNIVVLTEVEGRSSTSAQTTLKLTPLFQGTKPRLSCLETIYQSIYTLMPKTTTQVEN
ncbi:uncharacterized protein LOC113206474 [Frankliniella occidentalis]|uniref:Uncharacterized protein LOC113206474 n=1 Tax=Frankliniella occidentalis TaxID=133901 RepID=A0A6J1SBD7_FRAOC|nr:uncharacterized protein LOC113206474 [Frankliniella occidentalis]XP_026278356.1 uncharacterized protein LOC113206474 [Frankliniella occidentalis]XP_026278357.1 uncharacterized protein LOC113206474 [Frankliniella occidentalis]